MKKIIFATNNNHKAKEIQQMVGNKTKIVSLKDEGINIEIEEDGATLEENALKKAQEIYQIVKQPVFADDTGLEVEALQGDPGVNSARYSGEPKNDSRNLQKLLSEMSNKTNRAARFRTVICFIENDKPHFFEGIVNGKIVETPLGLSGFGYDPVFVPDGHNVTFAEMELSLKNSISHRGKAFEKFINHIKSIS